MITREQRGFINRALPVLKKDERIVGVALGGLYTYGATGDNAGIDFIIAVDPPEYDNVLADKGSIAESLGRLLAYFTAEHIGMPQQLICLYDGETLIHVDLIFQPLDKISKRMEDPEILYQSGTLMSDEYAKRPAEIPQPDIQWFEDRIWIWVHYIANRIAREELFEAIEGLSFLRQSVLGPLLLLKNGKPPLGMRNIETVAPGEVPRLEATLAAHDAMSCLRALKASTDLYIYLRGYNKTSLISREEAQKKALQYLHSISDELCDGCV